MVTSVERKVLWSLLLASFSGLSGASRPLSGLAWPERGDMAGAPCRGKGRHGGDRYFRDLVLAAASGISSVPRYARQLPFYGLGCLGRYGLGRVQLGPDGNRLSIEHRLIVSRKSSFSYTYYLRSSIRVCTLHSNVCTTVAVPFRSTGQHLQGDNESPLVPTVPILSHRSAPSVQR